LTIFITALKFEANPIIEFYDLQLEEKKHFLIYSNKDIKLIISGVGKDNSIIATTYILSKIDNNLISKVINIGICGSKNNCEISDIFLINKIIDKYTNKEYFPNILLKHNLNENQITTVNKPQENDNFNTNLVDMEAVGFFISSLKFVSLEKIMIIKIVSDFTNPEIFSKEFVENLIKNNIHKIDNFVKKYKIKEDSLISKNDTEKIDDIGNKLKLSFSKKVQFINSIKYYNCKNKK
jgi:hypothetical protein